MSTKNANRAALASATALQGVTVSPDVTPSVPTVTTDAAPMPADTNKTNAPTPSKRARDTYIAGLAMAVAGTDMSANGRGMIAAAIVDYALNSLKWTKKDALLTGQGNADPKDGALAQYHANCVAVFYGPRPGGATRKMTLSQQHAAETVMSEFKRQQTQITAASDLALCLIADGCTMRDYNATTGLWTMHGAHYCEDGCAPVDSKARYTMERCRADADYIPCNVGDETTQMRRDASWFVAVSSLRHSILSQSANAQAKREQRAPHRNAPSAPRGSRPNATPNATPPVPAIMTDAPIAPAVSGGNSPTTTTAPMDVETKATFANNIVAMRRALLALCEAPTVQAVSPSRLFARISPRALPADAWQAWQDFGKLWSAWSALNGAMDAKPNDAPAPVVHTEPTVIGGVTLSTPVAAEPAASKRAARKSATEVAA